MRHGCTIHQKAAGEGLGFRFKGEDFTISGGHLRHTGPLMSMQQTADNCACQVHAVSLNCLNPFPCHSHLILLSLLVCRGQRWGPVQHLDAAAGLLSIAAARVGTGCCQAFKPTCPTISQRGHHKIRQLQESNARGRQQQQRTGMASTNHQQFWNNRSFS